MSISFSTSSHPFGKGDVSAFGRGVRRPVVGAAAAVATGVRVISNSEVGEAVVDGGADVTV